MMILIRKESLFVNLYVDSEAFYERFIHCIIRFSGVDRL